MPHGQPAAPAPDPMIGQILAGRYRVQKLLGEGAIGAVYLAEHVMMRKPVALKILHQEMSRHKETVARFQREAQAAASINHPNICAATDFGRLEDGSFFLVMEHLDGRTLRQLNREEGPLDPQRAVHIARQMASALAQAHRQGIVHRDLKPENVMLVPREGAPDFVKLMDFGLARVHDEAEELDEERVRLTAAGVVYGTPAYMSPEQASAERDVDHRADLYALGGLLFEMIARDLPFPGRTVTEVLTQHLTAPPPSLRERAPASGAPRELDEIVRRLMAKDRDARFQSAEELIAALDAVPFDHLGEETHLEVEPPAALLDEDTIAEVTAPPGQSPPLEPPPSLPERLLALPTHIKIGAAAGVVLLLILLAVALSSGGDDPTEGLGPRPQDVELAYNYDATVTARTLASERDAFVADADGVRPALDLMAGGEHERAKEQLAGLASEHGGSAHYHYYLGVAQEGAKDLVAALGSYTQAISIDERYADDERVRDAIFDMLSSHDEANEQAARELITGTLLERYTLLLGQLAYEHHRVRTRRRARAILEETGAWEQIPAWRRSAIKLRQDIGCKPRAAAIEELAQADTPRALDPLREYSNKPKRGCGKKKRRDCYGCIRDDLARAISALEAKFPDAVESADPSSAEGFEEDEEFGEE